MIKQINWYNESKTKQQTKETNFETREKKRKTNDKIESIEFGDLKRFDQLTETVKWTESK